MAEKVYLNEPGVMISNSRVVFGEKTYVFDNITSVASKRLPPFRLPGFVAAFIGVAVFGLGSILYADWRSAGLGLSAIGVAVFGVGVFMAIKAKPHFAVRIITASTELNAIWSPDRDYISRIVAALNKAIAERK